MKIDVVVAAKSKQEKIEALGKNKYKVWISTPPIDGRANLRVAGLLSDYFNVPKSDILLINGNKSKKKFLK